MKKIVSLSNQTSPDNSEEIESNDSITPNTTADPVISVFISYISLDDLIDIPPLSKVIPLPIKIVGLLEKVDFLVFCFFVFFWFWFWL